MVTALAQFNHEKWPISATVTKTIADFRRTHLDTWEFQKLMFSEEQLEVIIVRPCNLLLSPRPYFTCTHVFLFKLSCTVPHSLSLHFKHVVFSLDTMPSWL